MCLYVAKNDSEVQIASKDIPVIKWLKRYSDGSLHSPCYPETFWNKGKLRRAKMKKLELSYTDIVEEGLHSFPLNANREVAKPGPFEGSVLCRMVIPRGAKYYTGKCFGEPSYASNQLRFVEIMDEADESR